MTPRAHRRRMPATVRRLIYALLGIGLVLGVGTLGFHWVAGLSPVDSFYFESMLATGQGPPLSLTTDSSKIFASVMAFVSVGSVVSTLLFAVGPIVRRFWREEAERVEAGARTLEQKIERGI